MASLFPQEPAQPSKTARDLPPDMRQLIVDLQAEHPAFRPHEIATICYVRFGRRLSHHTVQHVLASGPQPSITTRRFPPYEEIADGYERRRTVVQLHAEGWLLYWKAPSYALRRRRQSGSKVTQLVLFEVPAQEKAAGAEAASPFIRLVVSSPPEDENV